MYSHLDLSPDGKMVGVRFSAPGKFNDTEIMDLLVSLGDTVTADVQEAQGYE